MTQEQKDLLLKDLCARLPYKVKAQIPDEYGGYTSAIEGIDIDGFVVDFEGVQIEIEYIKPYLFPLSSMTEEQYYEMQTISGKDCLEHMKVEKDWRNNSSFSHLPLYEYRVIDFFDRNYFDYRGLIPMGLANDATGKNIY